MIRKATGGRSHLCNGNTLEGFQTLIVDVEERVNQHGREGQVKFAVNGFVIARETEEEAIRVLQEIQRKANKEAVEAFGDLANSKFDDLVQYNDGFEKQLIDILSLAFIRYKDDIRQFGEAVLSRVRRLEAQGRGKDEAFEISLAGDGYSSETEGRGKLILGDRLTAMIQLLK